MRSRAKTRAVAANAKKPRPKAKGNRGQRPTYSKLNALLRAALAWVEQRLTRSHAPDAVAPWTLSRMHAAQGRIAVAELVRRSGMSARRFTVRFERELGVTPKVYLRLLRLRRTLAALTPGGSLAALAERMGYCDQAHMNREFRELGGVTPTEVLRGRYDAGLTVAE